MSIKVLTYICIMAVVSNIRITSWNVRGLKTNDAYLYRLLDSCDVCCLQEHFLYEQELPLLKNMDSRFNVAASFSSNVDSQNCGRRFGQGGVAILYRHSVIKAIEINSNCDRFCGSGMVRSVHDVVCTEAVLRCAKAERESS